jgi:hypothetical protein
MFGKTLVVGLIGACLATAFVSTSAAENTAGCFVTGPKYTAHGRSTTKYGVAVFGVSCSFAKASVARIVVQHPGKQVVNGTVVGTVRGPSGWKCTSYDPFSGTGVTKFAYAGNCVPAAPPFRKKIAWNPA